MLLRTALVVSCCTLAFALTGCVAFPWDAPDILAQRVIGPEGGRVEGGGVALDIPVGALPEATEITIRLADRGLEPGYEPLSPVFRFEPSGLEFATPVTVTIHVASEEPGMLLWTTRDGASFELAGHVEAGLALGQTQHFSDAVAVESGGSCSPDARLDVEPCRRLCYCQASDMGDNACAVDPTMGGDRPYDPRPCPPASPAIGNIMANGLVERAAEGREILARRNGEACSGYVLRPIERHLCDCNFHRRASAEPLSPFVRVPLCRREWSDPSGTPECSTTLDGRVPESTLEEFATRAWTLEDDDTCSGYYVDYDGSLRGPVTGTSSCDPTTTNVGSAWVPVDGSAHSCQLFGWPAAGAPSAIMIDRAQCRLSDEDWAAARQRRDDCQVPARESPEMERTPRGPCDAMGNCPAGQRCREGQCFVITHTLAILRVPTEPSGSTELTGLNSTARDLRSGEMCPPAVPVTNEYLGIGYPTTYSEEDNPTGAQIDTASGCTEATRGHAEGDALLQLAQQRGRTPPPSDGSLGSNWGAVGGRTGGAGEMVVDRAPCPESCAPYGIDAARQTAGLEELTVRSPIGTVLYRDDLPPGGVIID